MNNKKDIEQLNLKQEQVFDVPDNFFDELEKDILSKTIEVKKVIPLHKNPWLLSIAATLIIGIGLFFQFNKTEKNTEVDYLANVSEEEILKYLEDDYSNTELYDYTDYYEIEVEENTAEFDVSSEDLIDELGDIDLESFNI